jgi:diamine N-acetyltransferase
LIRLVPVNKKNWRECSKLPTGEDHKFVAPNVWSIAEAQFWTGSRSCCIYHGDEMVGYALFNLSHNNAGELRLWGSRLMIAEPQRGKGYGRAALQQGIAEARQQGCVEMAISTELENHKAIRLYESLGFRSTGKFLGDEMIYLCWLSYP